MSKIKDAYETYTDAFKNLASVLTKMMKYHERLEEIQSAFERVAKLIEKRKNDLKTSDRDKFDDNELDCNLIEADDAMKDLIDFGSIDKIDAPIDLSQIMLRLNEDQKKVFDRVVKFYKIKIRCCDCT